MLEIDPTPPPTHRPQISPPNPLLRPRCGAPLLRSPYAPSINLKLVSLNCGLLLTKQTARRSFESNAPDVSRLCLLNLVRVKGAEYLCISSSFHLNCQNCELVCFHCNKSPLIFLDLQKYMTFMSINNMTLRGMIG